MFRTYIVCLISFNDKRFNEIGTELSYSNISDYTKCCFYILFPQKNLLTVFLDVAKDLEIIQYYFLYVGK